MAKKKKLGLDEVELLEPTPELQVATLVDEPEDLMKTLVGNKLLYGKKVVSCVDVGYFKLVDENGSVFVKSKAELDEVLK